MTSMQQSARDDFPLALPSDLPREFRQYEAASTTQETLRPGKAGLVELEVARRDGVSRVVRSYQQAPLQFLRPMYLDAVRPDMPFIVLMQQGGGIAQGDRYRLDITCHEGAAVHVTSQSATRLYKCEQNFATQLVTITAGAGSVVEYLPDITIPFRHARFYQRTDLHIDPAATLMVGEVLTAGRVAQGERHAYDFYCAQTHAFAPGGLLLAADTVKLQPPCGSLHAPALLGDYDAFGTFTIFSRQYPLAQLATLLREALGDDARAAGTTIEGVSELPNGCGVSVRILGSNGAAVEHARNVAWNAARIVLLGAPAPDLRKP